MAGAVRLSQFLEEEWVALGPLANRLEVGRGCIGKPRKRLEQLKRVIRSERRQLDGGDVRPPGDRGEERPQAMPAMKFVAPISANDQIRCGLRLRDEELQDGQGPLVRPVQVLNDENRGRATRILAKRAQKRAE